MQAASREGASAPEYATAVARLAPEPLISSSACSGHSRRNLSVHPAASQNGYRVLRRGQFELPSATRAKERCELLEHEDPVGYSNSVKFSRFGEIPLLACSSPPSDT